MSGINTGKIPLIAYGAIEDVDTWSESGTVNVTPGQDDPFGGTSAQLLEAATDSARAFELVTLSENDGYAQVIAIVKAGTAGTTQIRLRDTTAGVNRITLNIAWSGGVPTPSTAQGTVIGTVALDDAWYVILASGTGVVATNTNEFAIFPAGFSSGTGTSYVYVRDAVVLPLALNDARAFPKPREGSEKLLSASGIEDAWIIADDYFLTGDLRWITSRGVATPEVQSGWEGQNEHAWVNAGVESWLRHAWGANTFLWVPDRANSLVTHSSYLEVPFQTEEIEREENDTRRLGIRLRHADAAAYRGY